MIGGRVVANSGFGAKRMEFAIYWKELINEVIEIAEELLTSGASHNENSAKLILKGGSSG